MENLTDRQCIEKVIEGSTEAFAVLVGRYSGLVFSLCMRMTGNYEDAQDITQEVFIKIFDSLQKFKFHFESSFSTWLYRVAYNTSVSHLRKTGAGRKIFKAGIDNPGAENNGAEEVSDTEEVENRIAKLEKALSTLAPDDRALVTLFYTEDKSVDEISEIMSLSESNVKTRLHRIRKKLSEKMNYI